MNREQTVALTQIERLLQRCQHRLNEQVDVLGRSFSQLSDIYEGDGADEMDEMHQQLMARLVNYEEQLDVMKKIAKQQLGDSDAP